MFRFIIGTTASLVLLIITAVGGGLFYLAQDLPSVEILRTYTPAQTTRVYSDDKQLIGQFFIERRVFVPLSKIPKNMVRAILAVEDARFYEHSGFDWIRIIKAGWTNLENLQVKQGASTITQQLVRSLFLTPDKTMERKLKEILLARRMEVAFTKDEILEAYLNQIYFGQGAYGVQAAAKTYFGKDIHQVTLGEAAFIAGLPKAPNSYSPYSHGDKAKQRQQVVLKRMVDEGFITQEEYEAAYKKDLVFQKRVEEENIAPHFLEHVRQEMITRYGYDAVYKGGMSVYTSLNVEMQRAANQAVQEGLREIDKRRGFRGVVAQKQDGWNTNHSFRLIPGEVVPGIVIAISKEAATVEVGGIVGKMPLTKMLWARKQLRGKSTITEIVDPTVSDLVRPGDRIWVRVERNDAKALIFSLEQQPEVEGALIAIDPATGRVKAMVGGYDFNRSKFDRALLSKRQPGSAFKPMIYATAIERGLTAATVVIDNPVIYTSNKGVWKPENYDGKFYGATRLRDALAFSRNLATVKLLERIGTKRVAEFAARIGIRSPLTRNLSLALGTSEVSLIELTSAYGVFPNNGVRAEPSFIVSVKDHTGRVLEQHTPALRRVIARETAYMMNSMMEDVVQRGTGRRARALGRPLAGKTGTTNEFNDAWFIGYAPQIIAGVWVGFDDRRSIGDKETGAAAALPIWMAFMEKALARYPVEHFSIPEGIVYARIDPESGLRVQEDVPDAIVEAFIRGTVPPYKPEILPPNNLFEMNEEPF